MHSKEKIFKAFYESKKDKIYFNELKELTKLSNSSLQNQLKTLLQNNILQKEETKANVFFAIKNKKIFAVEYAKITMNHFETLHRNVRLPLKELADALPKEIFSVILFGSCARNTQSEKSDIDLLVILYSIENQKIHDLYEQSFVKHIETIKNDIQTRSNHHISLGFTTLKEFIEGKDHLVNQAKETGFPIVNEQIYFEALQNEYRHILQR
jgi:predicted nucleotidyltransferase